jgi:hypothetical protein
MPDIFDEVRKQIHEIRNLVSPVYLKMADLDMRIVEMKHVFEEKTLTLESKLLGVLFRLDKQDVKIADIRAAQEQLSERITRMENRQNLT